MSFYITLPSDSSMQFFPNNTVSRYRTYLPETIKLQNDYEVGLAEISYPRTWKNIKKDCIVRIWRTKHLKDLMTESKAIDVITKKDLIGEKYSINVIIPAGYYGTPEEMLEIMRFDKDHDKKERVVFKHNKPNRRVVVELEEGNRLFIPHEIAIMFGFTRAAGEDITLAKSETAPFSCDMDAGLRSLFIYSDIIQSRSV